MVLVERHTDLEEKSGLRIWWTLIDGNSSESYVEISYPCNSNIIIYENTLIGKGEEVDDNQEYNKSGDKSGSRIILH